MTETAIAPPQPASPCRPWGFWATTGFGLAAVIAWMIAQWLGAIGVLMWLGAGSDASDAEIRLLMSHVLMIAAVTIVSMPFALAVIALAARLAGCTVQDYLALHWPRRRDLLIGIACVAVALPLGDLSSYLTGRELLPPFVSEAFRSAQGWSHLLMLGMALVVAAPLMEELLFRGFLLRGYAASPLGVGGAILITAAAWAGMHVQYELFYIVQIFLLGCLFGWLRWRSGSTTLTLILHGLVNLAALLQAAYMVARIP